MYYKHLPFPYRGVKKSQQGSSQNRYAWTRRHFRVFLRPLFWILSKRCLSETVSDFCAAPRKLDVPLANCTLAVKLYLPSQDPTMEALKNFTFRSEVEVEQSQPKLCSQCATSGGSPASSILRRHDRPSSESTILSQCSQQDQVIYIACPFHLISPESSLHHTADSLDDPVDLLGQYQPVIFVYNPPN